MWRQHADSLLDQALFREEHEKWSKSGLDRDIGAGVKKTKDGCMVEHRER